MGRGGDAAPHLLKKLSAIEEPLDLRSYTVLDGDVYDLRKLATAVSHSVGGFAPVARYRGLLEFYQAHGFAAEAAWVAGRLAELRGAADAGCAPPRCEPCAG